MSVNEAMYNIAQHTYALAMKHPVMVIHEIQERRNQLFKEIEEL